MKTQMSNDPDTRRVSEKGWVVIPQELRNKYGLAKGAAVRFVDYGGVMGIVPVSRDPIKQGFGMLKGRRLTQSLLEERKRDREIEP
ncbi:MAG: AbrB/MazE/SpoVT family DNA-binding domain-containing protein [Firmicutes bacterium]|nr:AbrB/MazE/SpoVT family DNA-binding domain-containing protein [Bacillota bacterium]